MKAWLPSQLQQRAYMNGLAAKRDGRSERENPYSGQDYRGNPKATNILRLKWDDGYNDGGMF